jgi:hypothetical protein
MEWNEMRVAKYINNDNKITKIIKKYLVTQYTSFLLLYHNFIQHQLYCKTTISRLMLMMIQTQQNIFA